MYLAPEASLPSAVAAPSVPRTDYLPPIAADPSNDDSVILAVPQPAAAVEEEHHHHHDVPFWDFRESIPGEPESDYPILDKIPVTSFSCTGRTEGYYADMETRCQVFHICATLHTGDDVKNSFLCPNGTVFNQESFVCQWWADVNCAASESFYQLNENIGKAQLPTVAVETQQPAVSTPCGGAPCGATPCGAAACGSAATRNPITNIPAVSVPSAYGSENVLVTSPLNPAPQTNPVISGGYSVRVPTTLYEAPKY